MKFYVYLFPLFIFLISCGEYKKNDCNSDCTPRELSTPYYNLPSHIKPDLLGVTVKSFKDYLVTSKIVNIEDIKDFDESDTNSSKYIQLDSSSIIVVKPSPNPNNLKSIDYFFSKCDKIIKKDFDNIFRISDFVINENHKINSLFDFSFKGDEISTNQLRFKHGVVLEASCDPIDNSGQFHIYRE